MIRSLVATLVGALMGVLAAFFVIVGVLNTLHMKNSLVFLSVFAVGCGIGGAIAIGTRRLILLPSPSYAQFVSAKSRAEKDA